VYRVSPANTFKTKNKVASLTLVVRWCSGGLQRPGSVSRASARPGPRTGPVSTGNVRVRAGPGLVQLVAIRRYIEQRFGLFRAILLSQTKNS
jgi:hypothetical protein